MSRITLTEFAADMGQTKAATLLGMTQGALNKALRVGRDIYVTARQDGSFSAEEVRPFPSHQQSRRSAA
jgi:hypothetical protein